MFRLIVAAILGLALQLAPASASQTFDAAIRGRVVDATGAPVAGAQVRIEITASAPPGSTVTDGRGDFAIAVPPGIHLVTVSAGGFTSVSQRLTAAGQPALFTLQIAGVTESVKVAAPARYTVPVVSSATRTPTPLRDVPQSVSVVSRQLIDDQRMTGMSDVVRYMPGVGIAQGEGNRDTPILRGNSSTSDFFVDGVRDDAQYFRDVYNVERVEALKGPNAMVFGRGGVGGVINRVTRQADWMPAREASVQSGSWQNRRLTADLGHGVSDAAAIRVTGVFEDSRFVPRGRRRRALWHQSDPGISPWLSHDPARRLRVLP